MKRTRVVTALAGSVELSKDNDMITVTLNLNGNITTIAHIDLNTKQYSFSDGAYNVSMIYTKAAGICDCATNKKIKKIAPKNIANQINACNCISPGTLTISVDYNCAFTTETENFTLLVDVTKTDMIVNWRKLTRSDYGICGSDMASVMLGNTAKSALSFRYGEDKSISFGVLFDNYTEEEMLPGLYMMLLNRVSLYPFDLIEDPVEFGNVITKDAPVKDGIEAFFWEGEYAKLIERKSVEETTHQFTHQESEDETCVRE